MNLESVEYHNKFLFILVKCHLIFIFVKQMFILSYQVTLSNMLFIIIIIGYIKLILAMSWYQLLYDISLFNAASDIGNFPVLFSVQLFQFMGGIGSSIMSNWIAFVLFYVVIFEKSFDILKNYMYIILSTVIIWLPMVIIYSIGALPDEDSSIYLVHLARRSLYYYARLISISFNFVMIACILYRNYRIRSKSTTKTPAEIAINTLCRRVMYYPILQTISRSGYAWYESQYGFDFRVSQAEHNGERYTALMYSAIITPTVSFGYLIIFLYIEPNAYNSFKEIFCGIKAVDNNNNENENENENELNNEGFSESQSERIYNSASESFFSWDNFRSSTASISKKPSDYDNRSESEIFAIIDQSQLNQQSAIIELNNNINRQEMPNNINTITTNIIHDVLDIDVNIK